MRFSVDGSVVQFQIEGTPEELFESLLAELSARGRSVSGVVADGIEVENASNMPGLLDPRILEASAVDIRTVDVVAMLRGMLAEAAQAVSGFPDRMSQCVGLLQKGDPQGGATVAGIVSDVGAVLELLSRSLWQIGKEPSTFSCDGLSLHDLAGMLRTTCNSLLTGMKAQDAVASGDTLEFELGPQAAKLGGFIKQMTAILG